MLKLNIYFSILDGPAVSAFDASSTNLEKLGYIFMQVDYVLLHRVIASFIMNYNSKDDFGWKLKNVFKCLALN